MKDLCTQIIFPKNDINMAKRALQLSCLDQENLRLKIDQWKHESTHYFRPYIIKQNGFNYENLPPDV